MAASITEGVLWELQADDSQLVAAYRRAEAASDRAASVAAQSAQKSGAAYDGLKRKVDAAGAATARSMQLTRQQALTLQYTLNDVSASLASGGSPLTILLQQGGQVTQAFGGLRGTVVTLGPAIARAMLSPVGAVTTLAVAVGTIAVAAGNANDKLVAMADTARRTQQQAGAIVGAHIIGARVGLTGEQSDEALANAAKQFEAFRRNSGDVKKIIQDVDKGFLSVADKARTAGDFIGIVSDKIRSLPREEGLDLAKALFGEDAGARLFDAIRTGAVNMRDLANEAQKAGVSLDDNVIKRAEDMQRKIDAAAEIAGTKLLAAFQTLGDPVANLKLQWFEFVGGIGDAIEKSKELQLVMQGFLHPIDTVSNIINGKTGTADGGKFGRLITLDSNEYSKPGNEALLRPQAGESRARYEARQEAAKATRGGGRSDAERTAERYAEVTKHLRDQLALLSAQGAEHEHIALKLKIEAEQAKLGKAATQEQKDNVAALVTKLDEAERSQKRLTEQAQAFNEAYVEISGSITDSLKGLISGEKPKDALRFLADRLSGGLLEGGLTGAGPFAKLLGLEGKNGSVGGLFGFAADLLGFGGGKGAQTVNVKGSIVNVAGGQGGLVGETGGLFSNLFGSKGQGGILSSVVDFFSGFFAEGGDVPAGHWGVAGEKGPELVRGPATVTPFSKLASAPRAASQAPTVIHFNVTSPDAPSFVRSEAQVSALLTRALVRGQRNL
ncbi:MAG: phage tail length tape measure family protein [Methylocystis sp.]